ncbi:MAG: DUF1653 domain-containing protein [Alphaproteobacteria bacterium]|nr:DUF1653 domain-containing protein [Alphaproteobacteria bacterium]
MPEVGSVYIHYKNHRRYQIIAIGKNSETLEDVVVYKALYESSDFPYGQIWCRPLKMWQERVNGKLRFEKEQAK